MTTRFVWEKQPPDLERAPCPGGWLYRPTTGERVALTFVPWPGGVSPKAAQALTRRSKD